MGEQEKEAFLEEEKTEEMTMGNYRDKASLAGEDDQQAESVKSEVVVDGSVDDHLQRFNKALKQFLDAVETFLDALESSSAATAHCGVRKVKQERKKKKFCQKTSKLSSCESQASSSKRKRVQEAHSSFEEKVPNIRESSLCHGEMMMMIMMMKKVEMMLRGLPKGKGKREEFVLDHHRSIERWHVCKNNMQIELQMRSRILKTAERRPC